MPIRFACPHCEKTLKVDDRFAGRRAKCPNCRVPIDIPEQTPAAASTVAANAGATNEPGREDPEKSSVAGVPPVPATSVDRSGHVVPTGEGATVQSSLSTPLNAADRIGSVQPSTLQAIDASSPDSTAPTPVRAAQEVGSSPAPGASLAAPPPFARGEFVAGRPVPAAPPSETPPRDPEDDQFASPFEVFDDDAEIVYAVGYGREEPERFLVSQTRLAIPRAYVYLQGALLVAIAILSFLLGWAFGGSGSYRAADAPRGPVTLSGVVRVEGYDGPIAASEGALVAILPGQGRPSEKIPVDGLRPSEISRIVPPRTLSAIREMGGALAVSDSRGEFRAELPEAGEYLVLTVLPDVYRPTTSQIALADLARLGDYFLLPDQLIGDCRYSLTVQQVDESKTIEVRFP